MKVTAYGLEVLGLAAIAYAGYLVSTALGFAVAGIVLILLGFALGAGKR